MTAAVKARADDEEPPERRVSSLRDLYERPELLEPPTMLIPNLAYQGRVTLLSAREKCGKSTFMAQAAAAYSTGEPFLGEPIMAPGAVLWYCIDEALGDAVRRFRALGGDVDRLHLCDSRPDTSEQMAADAKAAGADVIVMDTASKWWRGKLHDENDANKVTAFLTPYTEAVRELGVALVVLHHDNKNGNSRGSTAISAEPDYLVHMKAPANEGDGEGDDESALPSVLRIIEGSGRGLSAFQWRATFDGKRYDLGAPSVPLDRQILLALSGDPLSVNALCERIGKRRQTVLKTVMELKGRGFAHTISGLLTVTPVGDRWLHGEATAEAELTLSTGGGTTQWETSKGNGTTGITPGTGAEPLGNLPDSLGGSRAETLGGMVGTTPSTSKSRDPLTSSPPDR